MESDGKNYTDNVVKMCPGKKGKMKEIIEIHNTLTNRIIVSGCRQSKTYGSSTTILASVYHSDKINTLNGQPTYYK